MEINPSLRKVRKYNFRKEIFVKKISIISLSLSLSPFSYHLFVNNKYLLKNFKIEKPKK